MFSSDDIPHKETMERYCHVIGENTPVSRFYKDGQTVYECMNRHKCEQKGGCKNQKFASEPKNV